MAGLPNSPNNTNPFENYQRSMRRAEYILTRMVKEYLISSEEKTEALSSPLELTRPREDDNPNRYFLNYVLTKLEDKYGKEFVHFGGLKIFTTLDTRLQSFAQKSALSHLEALGSKMVHGIVEKTFTGRNGISGKPKRGCSGYAWRSQLL